MKRDASSIQTDTPVAAPARRVPLFARHPGLAASVPWRRLGDFPTPVEPLADLGRELGVTDVYVKRDDQSHALYGGGKLRKLEPLLAEALHDGHESVAVWGGVGSNQAVATSVHGAGSGLGVSLLLLPQPPSESVTFNLLASLQFGARIRVVPNKRAALDALADLAKPPPDGQGAYVIEAGGSSPRGNLGFVNAAFELDEQISAGVLAEPTAIYLAMGSMGSAVGLGIGLALAGRGTQVVAVRASNPGTSSPALLRSMFDDTVQHLTTLDPSVPALRFEQANIVIDGTQVGAGYAQPTRAATAARRVAESRFGLPMESTYTAKAFAALLGHRASRPDETLLYWHSHAELRCRPNIEPSAIGGDVAPYVAQHPLPAGGVPCGQATPALPGAER